MEARTPSLRRCDKGRSLQMLMPASSQVRGDPSCSATRVSSKTGFYFVPLGERLRTGSAPNVEILVDSLSRYSIYF